jgi:hypothetical protein
LKHQKLDSVDNTHLLIESSNSKILGYRIRPDTRLVQRLEEYSAALPPVKKTVTDRGTFEERYYCLWAKYTPGGLPFISLDFWKDNKRGEGEATKWPEANSELVKQRNED